MFALAPYQTILLFVLEVVNVQLPTHASVKWGMMEMIAQSTYVLEEDQMINRCVQTMDIVQHQAFVNVNQGMGVRIVH